MIEITEENKNSQTLTPRLIVDEVLSRGWKVSQFYPGSGSYRLTRADGVCLDIFGATPPSTSYMAHLIAQDKFACYAYFEDSGYPLPKSMIAKSVEDGLNQSLYLLEKRKLVVKPLDKGHGMGVTTGISTKDDLVVALERALKLSSKVVIQEYIENAIDTRILVIDGKVCAALQRIPAAVIGDGKSTIEELVVAENNSGIRGDAYSKPLSKIKMAAVKSFFGKNIKNIPQNGEKVQVVGVANVGVGGETADITDNMPEWLNEMAIAIAEHIGLKVAGVDILLSHVPEKNSTTEEINPYLIEVNKCPALFIHEYPTTGTSRHVVSDYIDYLEKI